MTEDRLAELMVKRVDGLCTPDEEEELMTAASNDPELARELASHLALKRVTDGWAARLVADAQQDRWTRSVATRWERRAGMVLLVAGTGVLGGFGLWELWLDPGAPTWVKAGTGMLVAGGLILLVSVSRWAWQTRDDPYAEVER